MKVYQNIRDGNDWNDGVGKAALSGAVSGVISTLPIPGVGPLASAVITGGASNLAADAINGDIHSFKDAAWSLTEGAAIGAVTHGLNKGIDKGVQVLQKKGIIPKKVKISQLCNNLDDPYSDPFIGPAQGKVVEKIHKISQTGTYEYPEVRELAKDSYEILNGHHTVQALRSLGKKYVKVKLK